MRIASQDKQVPNSDAREDAKAIIAHSSSADVRLALFVSMVIFLSLSLSARAADPPTGYQRQASVTAETRLDWIFALANQSVPKPPAEWQLDGYDSKKQHYELFVPPGYSPKKSYPLVLFISAGGNPAGWKSWEAVCKDKGILFASPHEAGNDVPMERRVHVVMDVLDDLRRKYTVDPDRTYLAGFSGGGRVAMAIAFALPEYFGGAIPVCAGGDLREESWLRQRVADRLSVAMITGEHDFNRGEVERFRGPMLSGVGVRTKVWAVPGLGHAIPGPKEFSTAFNWLEESLPDRRKLAEKYPASRIAADKPLSREAWSQALFDEGQERLKSPKSIYSGLMQLKGISVRWADLPLGEKARKILTEYDEKDNRPWDADDIAEQRKFLVARARSLDAYASGDLPEQYAAQRDSMLEAALQLWQLVLRDGQDEKAVAEGKKRIPELKKLLDGE